LEWLDDSGALFHECTFGFRIGAETAYDSARLAGCATGGSGEDDSAHAAPGSIRLLIPNR
jgi:hypothetical protein